VFEDPRSRLKLRPKQRKPAPQPAPDKRVPERSVKKRTITKPAPKSESIGVDTGGFPVFSGKYVLWVSILAGGYSMGILFSIPVIILNYQKITGGIGHDAPVYLVLFTGIPSLVWANIVWYSLVNPELATEKRDRRLIETLQYFRITGKILVTILLAIGLAFCCAVVDMFRNQRTIDIYIIVLSIPAVMHAICAFILCRFTLAGGPLVLRWSEEGP
jgi:hypothetical protein